MIFRSFYLALLTTVIVLPSCNAQSHQNETIYQYATINALMEGGYDGELTMKNLQKKGDFGIGTFNALDGEMIGFDNHFYKIKSDGKAYPVKSSTLTPFAVVTHFKTELKHDTSLILNLKELYNLLDSLSPNKNLYVAYKIKVVCPKIKTRSVAQQTKPYPKMIEAVKKQSVFESNNSSGTLVGFRFPEYMQGLNVPGYHFHYIADDKQSGGHVLDLTGSDFKIEIDFMDDFELKIPNNPEFNKLNLTKTKLEDLEKVEK
ncbi:acetolactate decarboxylase [Flavobacterium sp.]|uniref:acetolactate decarboxylase n=1 Tax=Flavobacterium sp. TaxID=239 RepID=UPI003C32753F